MIKIEHNGQSGYFITEDQKKQLDKVLKPLLSDNVEKWGKSMNNHDYYPSEPTAYIIDKVIENDPDEEFMYAVEEHLYEQTMEDNYIDFEEIRIKELIQSSDNLELIKNEDNNKAFIL